jgi:lipopolysaccharide transport system permease protein
MAGFGLGAGIIVSALTTKYRDLQGLVPIGTQLMMYLTPIIYPVSSIPDKYRSILFLNPLTSVFETLRYAYLGSGTLDLKSLGYSAIFMIGLLMVGTALFNRVEATFMDTV